MSVYYNLKATNQECDFKKMMDFESKNLDIIINDQSKYMVGVERFKIPLTAVDFMRIYPNKYFIAHIGTLSEYASAGSGAIPSMNVRTDLFSPFAWKEENTDIDRVEGGFARFPQRYLPITSHNHFCSHLNRCYLKSIFDNCRFGKDDGATADFVFTNRLTFGDWEPTSKGTNGAQNLFMIDFTGKQTGEFVPICNAFLTNYTTDNTTPSQLIDLSFFINFNNNKMYNDTANPVITYFNNCENLTYFRDYAFSLEVELRKDGQTEPVEYYSIPFFDKVGTNLTLKDMGVYFPEGIAFSSSRYAGHTGTDFSNMVRIQSGMKAFADRTETDIRHLLGRAMDTKRNQDLGLTWRFNFGVRYNGKITAGSEPKFRFNVGVGGAGGETTSNFTTNVGLNLQLSTCRSKNWGTNNRDIYSNTYALDNPSLNLIPNFQWNEAEKKIQLMTQVDWFKNRGFHIAFNLALKNIMGFEAERLEFNIKRDNRLWDSQNLYHEPKDFSAYPEFNDDGLSYVRLLTMTRDNKHSMVFIRMNDSDFDYYDFNNENFLNETTPRYVSVSEQNVSNFKRYYVESLAILSPTLPIMGEYVGLGGSTRKVLTDFALDPSTNVNDYMIYNGGSDTRYYPLNAGTPLREIFVSVYYIDINNNLKRLRLDEGDMASIKLEFRPKNMIFTSN
tara:strand:+ start:2660 stop:4672 length:2013 start_codon:yes stop_codon:yes gene_type:complete